MIYRKCSRRHRHTLRRFSHKTICSRCDSSDSDEVGRYTYCPETPVRNRREKRASETDMTSRMSSNLYNNKNSNENNCNGYEGFEAFRRLSGETERGRSRDRTPQSQTTPEYVKRTAKLFEKASGSNHHIKNGGIPKSISEQNSASYSYSTEIKVSIGENEEEITSPPDASDHKKPSYLGVSCSNSGYRNVINYDSKIREGFRSSSQHRESLVLCNSRLRENSPIKFDYDVKSYNGNISNKSNSIEKTHVNGVHHNNVTNEKFVNISTSTKTISTFRTNEDKRDSNHLDFKTKIDDNSKVSLNQILNNDNHKRYSNLGLTPKVYKSPEKNCNSFLKSINSFENNCKTETTRGYSASSSSSTRKANANFDVFESKSSIQQRIERLYGPAALAQGFYVQKPTKFKSEFKIRTESESSNKSLDTMPQSLRISIESIPDLLPAAPEVVLPIEQNLESPEAGAEKSEPDSVSTEKTGHHFLKLLKAEIVHLDSLAAMAEKELENGENLPEEASGKLRAAAGKARLLVRQKLHQFEGLCQKNLNEKPGEKFPTTSEDLAGFWDMVMLQVVQVYAVFDEIKQLKQNNWNVTSLKSETNGTTATKKTPPNTTKNTPKKAAASQQPNSEKSEAMKKREESRKKMMEERKKKMKELKENKNINNESEIEIFAK